MARRASVCGREPPRQPRPLRRVLLRAGSHDDRGGADRAGAEEHGSELRAVPSGRGRGGGTPAGGAARSLLRPGAGPPLAGGEQGY